MKKISWLVFVFSSLLASSQEDQQDTVYTNIFTQISDYRNYNEVYLSNLGQAKYNLINPFDVNNQNVKSLFPEKSNTGTYTDIFYTLGTGTENYFQMEHTQQLGEYLFGNASLLKTNSLGIYRFQQADLSDFKIDLFYNNPANRYSFRAEFDNYKRYNEVNGGVPDSSFFALLDSNNANVKETFPIRLTNFQGATPNELDIKKMDVSYTHSYSLSKIKNDSVGYFSLTQKLNYKRHLQSYSIIDYSGFYDTSYYDTTSTNDSLKLEQFTHTFGIEYKKQKLTIGAGLGQNYFEYNSYSPFTTHLENFLYAQGLLQTSNLILFSSAELLFSEGGYESHYIKNRVEYKNDSMSFFQRYSGQLNYETDLPELYSNQYFSNHFKWNTVNLLNTIFQASLKAINIHNNLSVGVHFETQNRAIYFDKESQIGQTDITLIGLEAEKQFKLTNWLFWNTKVHVQNVTSSEAIEVPNLLTFNKLYARGRIIKKVLAFEAGINVLYYTSFNSRAYNPAIDQFYVQEEQSVGNYPVIDVFAEFYLKNSFAFFVTMTHVNSNVLTSITGKNYLATTNYPIQDRAFKFGFKWRLFD